MRLIALSTIISLLLIGCGESSTPRSGPGGTGGTGGTAGGTGGTDDFVASLGHAFDPQMIDVSEESSGVCQSWVLDNDEPVYVRKIRQSNDGGWHHSNWFFVPENVFEPNQPHFKDEGPDATLEGTWNCDDRLFSEYLAAAAGGVFFAQSTQTLGEVQAFPDGAALEIPPRSVIVGNTHLLNISSAPIATAMTIEVELADREDVGIRLTPFSFFHDNLNIPPMVDGVPTESRTSMECDLRDAFQQHLNEDEVDYNVYYVLGHYHQWGNYFNLSFVDDVGSEETIFEIKNTIGEPIGSIIDPPMNNNGASKLRSTCGFINNTDKTLTRGLQYGEMCDFLAYTDANLKIGSGGSTNNDMGVNEEGMPIFEIDCPNEGITGFKAYTEEF